MSEERMVEEVLASLSENMRKAVDQFNLMARYFRGARKEVVESWPIYCDGYYVMCGRDDCRCDMEGEIILAPGEGSPLCNFNLTELYDAIEAHIAGNRDEEAEDG